MDELLHELMVKNTIIGQAVSLEIAPSGINY